MTVLKNLLVCLFGFTATMAALSFGDERGTQRTLSAFDNPTGVKVALQDNRQFKVVDIKGRTFIVAEVIKVAVGTGCDAAIPNAKGELQYLPDRFECPAKK